MDLNIASKIFTYLYKCKGYENTKFLYHLKTLLTYTEENTFHIMLLKEIINGLINQKKNINDILAEISAVNSEQEVWKELLLDDFSNDDIKYVIKYVSETSDTILLKHELTNLEENIYELLNDSSISSSDFKDKFAQLVHKMFGIATNIEKEKNFRTQLLSKDTVNSSIQLLKQYYNQQKLSITLGLPTFDKFLGGLQSSRLYTFTLKSGEGKSTVMIDFSIRTFRNVKKNIESLKTFFNGYTPTVYYFTFENEIEESTERLFSNIANVSIREADMLDQIQSKIVEEFDTEDIKYEMYYSGAFTTSVYDIITFLESEKIKGNVPVAIFVDYLGIMKPTEKTDQKRLQLELITADLKNLATYYKIPVITGVQVKKDSYGGDLSLSDIKESSGIIDNSDVIVTMWRVNSQDEQLTGNGIYEYAVSIEKQRHGIANIKFKTYINFPIYKVQEELSNPGTNNIIDMPNSSTDNNYNSLEDIL